VAKVVKAPEFDDSRDGSACLLDSTVHDESIDLVGEWARLSMFLAVVYLPSN
jgi:hypothetical protein